MCEEGVYTENNLESSCAETNDEESQPANTVDEGLKKIDEIDVEESLPSQSSPRYSELHNVSFG